MSVLISIPRTFLNSFVIDDIRRHWKRRSKMRTLSLLVAVAVLISTPRTTDARDGIYKVPREIEAKEFIALPPTFATETKTMDLLGIARRAWKGYLSGQCEPWGMLPDGRPSHRFFFDNRALPWARLKHNNVDAPDNNNRNMGAHALLHAMLGDEKKNDPIEAGQVGYLLSMTDPQTGLPFTAEALPRGNTIGNGELSKNIMLLYEHTGEEWLREWAKKTLHVFRQLAYVRDRPGIGPAATYFSGGLYPGPNLDLYAPPATGTTSPTYGGWLHLMLGWNIWPFAKWHELTDDREALDFGLALSNQLFNGEDPDGNGGSFRADGSFGGKSQKATASWHMHGHTHGLPGLVLLGRELLRAGRTEDGLKTLGRARTAFDWLYDPEVNPDAGSWTGWLGEWLMFATGWDRKADCEGCTMGDVAQVAATLGAASRQHEDLADMAKYYDRAEQIFRGQVVESILTLRPDYLAVMKDSISRSVKKTAGGAIRWSDTSTRGNHALSFGAAPLMEKASFPGADRKEQNVLRFTGKGYFKLDDSAALRVQNFRLHAVVLVENSGKDHTIYSNYNNPINWGKGVTVAITKDRQVYFFTTAGTQASYDPQYSKPLEEGFHVVTLSHDAEWKNIYVDGERVARSKSKKLEYDASTVATVGALREFGSEMQTQLAELVIADSTDANERQAIDSALGKKYGISMASTGNGESIADPILWLRADKGLSYEGGGPLDAEQQEIEAERRYQESVETARRMEGRLLGLCGFPDWVNHLPSTLDKEFPGIDMMGCCADAVVRATHAVWEETVTGDANETRVNMAFNRDASQVRVVSSLPHRGEINVLVKSARRVLVRVPEWAPRDQVEVHVDREPAKVAWDGSYVIFDSVHSGQQLTVTYPLRVAEIREPVNGVVYTEKWRGNTIVDIEPKGKWVPMFVRPGMESPVVP
jgi:hypothetical protein